jgi:hypothetical protein
MKQNFRHQDSGHSADIIHIITAENILCLPVRTDDREISLTLRKRFKRCWQSCTTKDECVKSNLLNNEFDLIVCQLILRDPVQGVVCGHRFCAESGYAYKLRLRLNAARGVPRMMGEATEVMIISV